MSQKLSYFQLYDICMTMSRRNFNRAEERKKRQVEVEVEVKVEERQKDRLRGKSMAHRAE